MYSRRPGGILDMAGHPGPQSPNNSEAVDWKNTTQVCGRTPATGCLYDVFCARTLNTRGGLVF